MVNLADALIYIGTRGMTSAANAVLHTATVRVLAAR